MNVILVLVASCVLAVSASGSTRDRYASRDSGSSSYGGSSSSYGGRGGGSSGGYGSRSGTGRGGYGYGQYQPPPPPPPRGDKPLTDLDALYDRADNVLIQLRFASEELGNLESRLGAHKNAFEQLVTIIFEELDNVDARQNLALDALEAEISELEKEISNELKPSIEDLGKANDDNLAKYEANEDVLQKELSLDVRQDMHYAELLDLATGFKDKLLQVEDNYFELFTDQVERSEGSQEAVEKKENRRLCESGKVTLRKGKTRATIPFVNKYKNVPNLIIGVSSLDFNLKARDTTPPPTYGYGGYGYGYTPSHQEPNSIGLKVYGYATTTDAVVEGLNLSFGDSDTLSYEVSYQVCEIGPGIGPVKY